MKQVQEKGLRTLEQEESGRAAFGGALGRSHEEDTSPLFARVSLAPAGLWFPSGPRERRRWADTQTPDNEGDFIIIF